VTGQGADTSETGDVCSSSTPLYEEDPTVTDRHRPVPVNPADPPSDLDGPSLPSRRSVVVAAAWAVPVVSIALATPAHAASSNARVTIGFPDDAPRGLGADLSDATVLVVSQNGVPLPGESVTFTVTGPAAFADGATSFTTVTNGAGVAVPTGLLASLLAGGVVTLTATVSGVAPVQDTITITQSGLFAVRVTAGDRQPPAARQIPDATGDIAQVSSATVYLVGDAGRAGSTAVTTTGEVWAYTTATGGAPAWSLVDTGADPSVAGDTAFGYTGTWVYSFYVKDGQVFMRGGADATPTRLFTSATGSFVHLSAANGHYSGLTTTLALTAITSTGEVWTMTSFNRGQRDRLVDTGASTSVRPATTVGGPGGTSQHRYVKDGQLFVVANTESSAATPERQLEGATAPIVQIDAVAAYHPELAGQLAETAVTSTGQLWASASTVGNEVPWELQDEGVDVSVRPATAIGGNATGSVHYYAKGGQLWRAWSYGDGFDAVARKAENATGRVAAIAAASTYKAGEDPQIAYTMVTTTGEVWGHSYIATENDGAWLLGSGALATVAPATSIGGTPDGSTHLFAKADAAAAAA
jgi:hypothetical protein